MQSFLSHDRVVDAHIMLLMLQQMRMPVDVVMYNLVMTGYKKSRLWQPVYQVGALATDPSPLIHPVFCDFVSYAHGREPSMWLCLAASGDVPDAGERPYAGLCLLQHPDRCVWQSPGARPRI